ncbi:MAG TPA: hypothetical protein P5234_11340 [Thermoanaerobaculaceae bacterium]|nr:hypothetical protein [Thermoanaerobaculaceae bacterium]HRS16824.1 hypothetical protein [Thermoanaerobaculaceae bacterium]
MRVKSLMLGALVAAMAATAMAGDVILPTFAWNIPGKGGNNWSSEVYLTNPGPQAIQVTLAGVFIGRIKESHPCLPPSPVVVEVPAYSTHGWVAARLAMDLGCPDYVLAGLLLRSEGLFVVNSRMINTRAVPSPEALNLLQGLSQEVPGIPVEALLQKGEVYMVPGLGWEPVPCGPVQFENYLQIVNPNDEEATLTIGGDALLQSGGFEIDGRPVAGPHQVKLGARSWLQVKVGPGFLTGAPCRPATVGDVFVSASAPVALYGSVVDRKTQDPRTMMPVKVIAGP